MKKATTLLTMALMSASTAYAQTPQEKSFADLRTGVSLSLYGSTGKIDYPTIQFLSQSSQENQSYGGGLGLGFQYAFTNYLGATFDIGFAGYAPVDNVSATVGNDSLTITSVTLYAPIQVGLVLASPFGLQVYGKVGAAYMIQPIKHDAQIATTSENDTQVNKAFRPMYTLGVAWQYYAVSIYGEYFNINGNSNNYNNCNPYVDDCTLTGVFGMSGFNAGLRFVF